SLGMLPAKCRKPKHRTVIVRPTWADCKGLPRNRYDRDIRSTATDSSDSPIGCVFFSYPDEKIIRCQRKTIHSPRYPPLIAFLAARNLPFLVVPSLVAERAAASIPFSTSVGGLS